MDDVSRALVEEMEKQGVSISAYVLALGRVLPSALLVPAFGFAESALPIRFGLALALGLGVAPLMVGDGSLEAPLLWAFLSEIVRGLPVAVAASAALWATGMAGTLADELRSGGGARPGAVSPLSILLSLLVVLVFLTGAGPERLVLAHAETRPTGAWLGVAGDIVQGVELAVTLAAPLLVVSLVVEAWVGLAQRVAAPLGVQQVLAPLRPFLVLAALALLLERIVELLRVIVG